MKALAMALLSLILIPLSAHANLWDTPVEIPDCYQAEGAVPGQFILHLQSGTSPRQKTMMLRALGSVDLTITNQSMGEAILVERKGRSPQNREQQLESLAILKSLIGFGVIAVECNDYQELPVLRPYTVM